MESGIKFLTDQENEIMRDLKHAMSLFETICANESQNPSDTYNFGHYIDAAMNAVILRGARRMDPEHLMKHSKTDDAMEFNDMVTKLVNDHDDDEMNRR